MKVAFISQSGIYDYEKPVIEKYAPFLAGALVIDATFAKNLFAARVDHVNTAVYFDRTQPFFYSDVCLDIQMLMHAVQLSK